MQKLQIIKDLEAASAKLPALIEAHAARLVKLYEEMAQLKKAGLIYAKGHMRDGRYFYLVYPVNNGQRKREYIGTDPTKIQKAKDAIARAIRYDALDLARRKLEGHLHQGREALLDTVAHLAQKKDW